MALPFPNLAWIEHGEPAEGSYSPTEAQTDIAPVNRPTYQLLLNDNYLDEKFAGFAELAGAEFTGPVLYYGPILDPKSIVTKEYVHSVASQYIHTQSVAASIWPVEHNLGRRPAAVYIEINGEKAEAGVKHVDENNLLISLAAPNSGRVYLT